MKVVTYKWALVHWTCLDSWSTEQNPKSMLDRRLRIAMALCHLTSIVLLNLNVYLLDSSRALLFAPMLSEVWSSTDHNIIIYTGISVQTDISVDWMLGGGESWNCFELWQQCSLKLANGARAIWSTQQQTILERRKPLFEMNGFHSAVVPLSRSVWKVLRVTLLLFLRWLKALKNSHSSKLNRYVFWELSYFYF